MGPLTITFVVFIHLLRTSGCYRVYLSEIPNSHLVPDPHRPNTLWHGLGHKERAGGGGVDCFGEHFSHQGYKWTETLCHTDSDRDGLTNGQELGDPSCSWVAKSPYPVPLHTHNISHPGICEPVKTPFCQEQNSMEVCRSIIPMGIVNVLPPHNHPQQYSQHQGAPQLPEISHPDWRMGLNTNQQPTNGGYGGKPQFVEPSIENRLSAHDFAVNKMPATGLEVGYNTRMGNQVAALPNTQEVLPYAMGNTEIGRRGLPPPPRDQAVAGNEARIKQVYDNIDVSTVAGVFTPLIVTTTTIAETHADKVHNYQLQQSVNGSETNAIRKSVDQNILDIQSQIKQLQKKHEIAEQSVVATYSSDQITATESHLAINDQTTSANNGSLSTKALGIGTALIESLNTTEKMSTTAMQPKTTAYKTPFDTTRLTNSRNINIPPTKTSFGPTPLMLNNQKTSETQKQNEAMRLEMLFQNQQNAIKVDRVKVNGINRQVDPTNASRVHHDHTLPLTVLNTPPQSTKINENLRHPKIAKMNEQELLAHAVSKETTSSIEPAQSEIPHFINTSQDFSNANLPIDISSFNTPSSNRQDKAHVFPDISTQPKTNFITRNISYDWAIASDATSATPKQTVSIFDPIKEHESHRALYHEIITESFILEKKQPSGKTGKTPSLEELMLDGLLLPSNRTKNTQTGNNEIILPHSTGNNKGNNQHPRTNILVELRKNGEPKGGHMVGNKIKPVPHTVVNRLALAYDIPTFSQLQTTTVAETTKEYVKKVVENSTAADIGQASGVSQSTADDDWHANIVMIIAVASGCVAVLVFLVIVLTLVFMYNKRSNSSRLSQFQ